MQWNTIFDSIICDSCKRFSSNNISFYLYLQASIPRKWKAKPFLIIQPYELNFTEITPTGIEGTKLCFQIIYFSIISKLRGFCLVNSLTSIKGCSYKSLQNNDITYINRPLKLTHSLANNAQAVDTWMLDPGVAKKLLVLNVSPIFLYSTSAS